MANPVVDTTAGNATSLPSEQKIGIFTRLAYGFGAVAYGVKENGFSYFLLLFYSQVVGISPQLVGTALLVALVVDAFSDPIIGYWSDNLKSPWGRRHPFMYASAIPVAVSYFLLWTPPEGWSEMSTFWYLLTLAVAVRTFITLYETPSTALGFELSTDYEERSGLISYRYFFAWVGGNAITVIMFAVVFVAMATATIADGRFNPASYEFYGWLTSSLIFAAIVVSALGTHKHISRLSKPKEKEKQSLSDVFSEIRATLWERSFLALFIAAMFGAIAAGMSAALSFYFYTYFWGFTSEQTGLITFGVFGSAIIGAGLAPVVTKWLGKKRAAMIIGPIAFLGSPMPIVLRLLDVLPENGDPVVFWFVFFTILIDVGLIICFQILTTSMMADLVENSEVRTNKRSEGIFASSSTFIRKLVQGFGIMAATTVLTLAEFPVGAKPEDVSDETLFRFGLYYAPIIVTIWMSMVLAVSFYKLRREDHERNLSELERRRKAREADEASAQT